MKYCHQASSYHAQPIFNLQHDNDKLLSQIFHGHILFQTSNLPGHLQLQGPPLHHLQTVPRFSLISPEPLEESQLWWYDLHRHQAEDEVHRRFMVCQTLTPTANPPSYDVLIVSSGLDFLNQINGLPKDSLINGICIAPDLSLPEALRSDIKRLFIHQFHMLFPAHILQEMHLGPTFSGNEFPMMENQQPRSIYFLFGGFEIFANNLSIQQRANMMSNFTSMLNEVLSYHRLCHVIIISPITPSAKEWMNHWLWTLNNLQYPGIMGHMNRIAVFNTQSIVNKLRTRVRFPLFEQPGVLSAPFQMTLNEALHQFVCRLHCQTVDWATPHPVGVKIGPDTLPEVTRWSTSTPKYLFKYDIILTKCIFYSLMYSIK